MSARAIATVAMFARFATFIVPALIACLSPTADVEAGTAMAYPSKPVRVVVGQAAGGGTDTVARLAATHLAARLGQPVVVENRTGAGGIVSADYVAKSPADGHTLLLAPSGTLVANSVMHAKLPYSVHDFAPISLLCTFPLVLAVNATLPVHSVQELVAHLKAHPNKANASGSGTAFQLLTELFKQRTGVSLEYIQYTGSNLSINALLANQVAMTFVDTGPVFGLIKAGRIRPLAVTSPDRLPSLSDVPTMAELGLRELEVQFWMGLFAPAGTPVPIVKQLEDEVNRLVGLPDFRAIMDAKLVAATALTAEAFARFIAAEIVRWEGVRKAASMAHLE